MAFPTSRETTYAAASQVKSADLNKMQDRIVGFEPLVFADITVTPDHTIDRLVAGAPHGIETGTGPVRLTTTGTIPTGLSTSVDYWVTAPFNDTFALYPTVADALAGSNLVTFSSNGTGTLKVVDTATTTRIFDKTIHRDLTVNGTLITPVFTAQMPATFTVNGATQFNADVLLFGVGISTSGAQAFFRGHGARAAAPATGTHVVGEIVFNADPIAGGFIGWVCVTAGTPGTWKSFGAISA